MTSCLLGALLHFQIFLLRAGLTFITEKLNGVSWPGWAEGKVGPDRLTGQGRESGDRRLSAVDGAGGRGGSGCCLKAAPRRGARKSEL